MNLHVMKIYNHEKFQGDERVARERRGPACRTLLLVFFAFLLPIWGMGLLVLSNCIPTSHFIGHLQVSSSQLCNSAQEMRLRKNNENIPTWWEVMTRRDLFTDSIMLGIVAYDLDHDIVEKSLNTKLFAAGKGERLGNTVQTLQRKLNGDVEGLRVFDYGRYWHGYLVFLRPLLVLFDYNSIITLNYIILDGLLIWLTFMLYRVFNWKLACCFVLSMLLVLAPLIPMSLQYADCFFLAYAASLYALHARNWTTKSLFNALLLFFIVGAATSFLDILTTPILTLCIPLTIWTGLRTKLGSVTAMSVVKVAASWFAGYAYMWISKWILISLFTSNKIFHTIYTAIMFRSLDIHDGSPFPIRETISKFLSPDFLCLVVFTLCFFVYLFFSRKEKSKDSAIISFVIVGLLPFAWCVLLMQHTFHHLYAFTWRDIAGVVFPFLWILVCFTSPRVFCHRAACWLNKKS